MHLYYLIAKISHISWDGFYQFFRHMSRQITESHPFPPVFDSFGFFDTVGWEYQWMAIASWISEITSCFTWCMVLIEPTKWHLLVQS